MTADATVAPQTPRYLFFGFFFDAPKETSHSGARVRLVAALARRPDHRGVVVAVDAVRLAERALAVDAYARDASRAPTPRDERAPAVARTRSAAAP